MQTSIHPTAIVDPKAEIDSGAEIGPYCIIREGVRIKKGSRLFSNVVVEGTTEIGEQCLLYPFATIGLPPQDLKYNGENTALVIGDNNIIREYVSIHRASVGGDAATTIGSNNFFMAYVHIGHNCKIGSNTIMTNGTNLGGHVTIEDFVVMGGCSAVHQYSSIGKYVMIGGLSRVVQDVPPYMIAAGYDLKLFGPNTIGLKRNGFTDEEINRIKKAYKILFREKLTLKDAIKKIHEDMEVTSNIMDLITFIEKNTRGICR